MPAPWSNPKLKESVVEVPNVFAANDRRIDFPAPGAVRLIGASVYMGVAPGAGLSFSVYVGGSLAATIAYANADAGANTVHATTIFGHNAADPASTGNAGRISVIETTAAATGAARANITLRWENAQ